MIKPFLNHVLIKPDKPEKKTESGIILPSESKDTPQTGKLVFAFEIENLKLKKWTKVWFNKWSEKEVDYDNQKYFVVHYKDLLAYEE